MIDMHIHATPPNLPGVGSLSPLLRQPIDVVAAALKSQMNQAGIEQVFAMGSWNAPETDPLGIDKTLRIAELVPGMRAIGIANPQRNDAEHLRRVEAELAAGKVVALKAYLGYVHFAPNHPGYAPYYELAARFKLPFIFHTGDTYSPYAKLKFAHPLGIDEVAVDHPDVRFVMAHVGNPWMLDAAEVVYKNMNVWVDLSGLVVGDETTFTSEEQQDTIADVLARVRSAWRYAERPNRFLYGSDWPLAPMRQYRQLIEQAIPPEFHEPVFRDNARLLFQLRDR